MGGGRTRRAGGLPVGKGDRTRTAILEAARRQFALRGYDRTSLRSIAAEVGVDASLVIRHFTSKDALFAASVDIDLRLPDLAATPAGRRGERVMSHFVAQWEGPAANPVLPILLRSAVTHEAAAGSLRAVFLDQVVVMVGDVVPADAVALSASLVSGQLVGLAVTRYLLRLPGIADLSAQAVVAVVAPMIDASLRRDRPGRDKKSTVVDF